MYDVEYKDGGWWISKDGKILEELGMFSDPLSPRIILEEMNGQV